MAGRVLLMAMAVAMVWSATSAGQPDAGFEACETEAGLRDVAPDPARGVVYAAVQERDAVWVMDFGLTTALEAIPVGKSPVALALSINGTTLACVNRLDNSLTLIDTARRAVRATVPVGESPVAVAVLPDGRFLVVNSFSDSVSVVDASDAAPIVETIDAPAVPGTVAVGDDTVAVGVRMPPSVRIYGLPSWRLKRTIALPEAPRALAWSGSRLAVGMRNGIRLYGADDRLLQERETGVNDLQFADGRFHALSGSNYLAMDGELNTVLKKTLTGTAQRLSVADGFHAALSAGTANAYIWDRVSRPTTETAQSVDETALIVADAANVDAATPPSRPKAQNVTVPAFDPEPELSAPLPEGETISAPDENPAPSAISPRAPSSKRYRKNPINTRGVRAPTPRRPATSPLRGLSKQSIADAITQPSEFLSAESSFRPPDRNERGTFQGDTLTSSGGVARAEGNVRLRLGDMYATMDRLDQYEETGVIHGEGNVHLEQGQSTLRTDAFTYYPAEDPAQNDTLFDAGPVESSDGERLRVGGRLEAMGVDLREPTREMTADRIVYDFDDGTGTFSDARGRAGIYFFAADEIRILGPDSIEAKDVWVTTCDHDPPHYRLRLSQASVKEGEVRGGTNARLQLWGMDTPLWLPKWRRGSMGGKPWNIDFDTGRRADIGYYVNVGQQFELSPTLALGPRFFVTEKEGVGLGADLNYDFTKRPASWLYGSQGEIHGLQTTEGRGLLHLYHRYEYNDDLVLRAQVEQWSEEDFYKDFYFDRYINRTAPRTFVNATYRQDAYVATATVRPSTHAWTSETERLPEVGFHLLERPIVDRLLLSFDTVDGYNSRQPRGSEGFRTANVARLTYDWDPLPALAVTPFWEVEGTWYARDRESGDTRGRLTTTFGVTAQTRLHKTYDGFWGFSAFKHLIVPSVTYSYRPNTSIDPYETPRYDSMDNVYGRSRIELKLDNVFYGRDAETEEVWQVGRFTLYQGNDFSSEFIDSEDYEVEFDLRPRPWWGAQLAGERHVATNESSTIREQPFRRNLFEVYERLFGDKPEQAVDFELNDVFGDYNRVLAQLYYDNSVVGGNLNGRVGYAYTETDGEVYNRDILYGIGVQLGENWGLGFEHIYDMEQGELRQQTYEIRRSLHCWETSVRLRDRESGFDVNVAFNIKAFPGSKLKF